MPDIDHILCTNVVLEQIPYKTEVTHLNLEGESFFRVVQEAADPDRPDDVVLLPVAVVDKMLRILKGH